MAFQAVGSKASANIRTFRQLAKKKAKNLHFQPFSPFFPTIGSYGVIIVYDTFPDPGLHHLYNMVMSELSEPDVEYAVAIFLQLFLDHGGGERRIIKRRVAVGIIIEIDLLAETSSESLYHPSIGILNGIKSTTFILERTSHFICHDI